MSHAPDPHNPLAVFVYGTLKRGERNHARYAANACRIEPAAIVGRLWRRHTGTPILELPPGAALAPGTNDPLADLATQQRFSLPRRAGAPSVWLPYFVEVRGELCFFEDVSTALPHLDELEEFVAGQPSLYDRVLAPLIHPTVGAAWTYVIPAAHTAADYQPAVDPSWWDPAVERSGTIGPPPAGPWR